MKHGTWCRVMAAGAAALIMACGCSPSGSGSSSGGGMWNQGGTRPPQSGDGTVEATIPDGWLAYDPSPGTAKTGALDFSWMNEMPAGQHGHVLSKDGGFVFEDGTPVKFFGVAIGFNAVTPDKTVAEAMAAELASSGVNMVRLHAFDCTYSGFINFSSKETNDFVDVMLDKMDYLVHCLKQKGIYIHLDTNAGRVIRESDGFTAEEVAAGRSGALRATRVFDERIAAIEREFVLKLLEHVNPYTNMSYATDPVIAVVQYANETSITWYDAMGVNTPFTKALYARYNAWLLDKYGSREALDAAWTDDKGNKALQDAEDPAKGTVAAAVGVWGETFTSSTLSFDQINCPPRHADFMSFLMSIQTDTFQLMYDAIRSTGYISSINCSNQAEGPVDLALNAQGDVMEKNVYWNHPIGNYQVPTNFHKRDMATLDPHEIRGGFETHSISVVSRASVTDKPLIVTEWNAANPTEFRGDAIFQMAAYGALQDWDGICLFIYTFEGSEYNFFHTNSFTSFFNANVDPAVYGQFGMAAMIFRLGIVKTAENSVEVALTKSDVLAGTSRYYLASQLTPFVSRFSFRLIDDVYEGNANLVIPSGNTASGDYTKAKRLMMLSENLYSDPYNKTQGRTAWLNRHIQSGSKNLKIGNLNFKLGSTAAVADNAPASGLYFSDADFGDTLTKVMQAFGLLDEDKGWLSDRVVSDTGEITYTYNKNFRLDAPQAAVFAGLTTADAKGNAVGQGYVETANDKAAVAAVAMDGKPLGEASKVLIYAIGRCANLNTKWEDNTLTSQGGEPVIYEDIRGTLFLPSGASSCTVWGLDSLGNRQEEIPVAKTDGGYLLTLGGHLHYEAALG